MVRPHALGADTSGLASSFAQRRAQLAWIHVYNKSRGTRGRRFLASQYPVELPRISHIRRKYLVSINTQSIPGYQWSLTRCLSWPNPTDQIIRYSADRTGIMSFANFPLLWLFGGRNNILMWATGWSFATFNIYHRHVARVATLQGVVHSLLYVVIYIRGKKRSAPMHILCSSITVWPKVKSNTI